MRTRSVMYILSCWQLHAGQPSLLPVSLLPSSFLPSAVLGDKEMVTEQTIPPSPRVLSHHRGHQTFHLTISSHFPPTFPPPLLARGGLCLP